MRTRAEIMDELNGAQPDCTSTDYGAPGQAKTNHRLELEVELLLDCRDLLIEILATQGSGA